MQRFAPPVRHSGMGWILRLALVLTLAAASSGCATTDAPLTRSGERTPDVIVVVLDELPLATLVDEEGRIDHTLFPNFARLQEDSTWFRNATTGATFTHEVLPSILTGIRPREELQSASFLPHNLFTALAGTHDLHTTQPFPRLCPEPLCRPMPPASRLEPLRKKYPDFSSGPRGEKVLSLTSFIAQTPLPRLYFAHFVLPHQPWAYLPSGERYASADLLPGQFDSPGRGKGWADRWWLTAQAYQRHLLQTQFTDRLLGELLDRMERERIYDDSLLIVTADHGIAFEPGLAKRMVEPETIGQLAHVPLFVKRPRQRKSAISNNPVELADVVPTIADVVGVPYDFKEVEGTSLFHRKGYRPPQRTVGGLPISQTGAELTDAVALKYAMFDRVGASIDPFTIGSPTARSLVGTSVERSRIVETDVTFELTNAGLFASNDRIPSLMHGTLGPSIADGSMLAVALDGKIAAVTPAYKEGGVTQFYCMLPPQVLRDVREIAVFEIGPRGQFGRISENPV